MKTFLIIFGLIFSISVQAAIAPSGLPSAQFGSSVVGSNLPVSPPTIAISDLTKAFGVHCGFGTSSMTVGNYYRCFRDGGTTAGSDWQVTSGKTAYCSGFYMASASNLNTAFTFGYGTAAISTNNTSSAPTGNVNYSPNGVQFYFPSQPSTGMFWISTPISFPASSFPYLQGQNTMALNVNLICQEL